MSDGPNRFREGLKGHRNAKDQLLRASQAIPPNIGEGNGKATDGDRRRRFGIARDTALECGAVQDVPHVRGALSAEDNVTRKDLLDRIVAMLTRLGRRGYTIHADHASYATGSDADADSDPDLPGRQAGADAPRQPRKSGGESSEEPEPNESPTIAWRRRLKARHRLTLGCGEGEHPSPKR